MDKDVVHVYNEILLSHLKKNTICKNRNGLREYYAKGSKSDKVLYDISLKIKQMREYNKKTHREQDSGYQ